MNKLYFSSDYMEGAHPNILNKLLETNLEHSAGYGYDEYTLSAKERIKKAIHNDDAQIYLLTGGTQTNTVMIQALLKSYEGVIACDSGHVSVHEAGAIEHSGHKVLTVPHINGKLNAQQVHQFVSDFYDDCNHDHMVSPGMVYISQPTEYGTLYSKDELKALYEVCQKHHLYLYVDGARLAYALACKQNDVTLEDLGKYTDAFYIGGTKCGALFGEAVVLNSSTLIPHFFTMIKQNGALLAKGRIAGIQFDELFKDHLYLTIGKSAIEYANMIRTALKNKGYTLFCENPTNQVFFIMNNKDLEAFGQKVEYGFWEKIDDESTAIRLATSWATTKEDVDALIALL